MILVPPEGPIDADIAIVGESPGRKELAQGRPFVGESGTNLDQVLSDVGLERGEIYITNLWKGPIPSDKDSFFFNQDGTPTQEMLSGMLEVINELKEVKPNVVAVLGNFALWALTQKEGITNWRGSVLESSVLPGQKIIPCIHPAWYIRSRQWNKWPLFEWDWQKIKRHSESPLMPSLDHSFCISPTPEEAEEWKEKILLSPLITIDTEWYNPDTPAYVGVAISETDAITYPLDSQTNWRIAKEICRSGVPKVMQNAMFDVVALHRVGIDVKNVVHDTMVAWNACWGDLGDKKLKTIASVLTDIPFYKEDVEFVGRDEEKGQEYCCTDCVATHQSMQKILSEEFSISQARKAYDISMSIMDDFLLASKVGILADREKIRTLAKYHLDEANRIEQEVSEAAGYTINCRSAPQIRQFVYSELGISRQQKSTKQEILMDIAASHGDGEIKDLLTKIIRVRQHRNIVSRSINEGIIDLDGRIRCTWNLAGTRNGRLSTTIPWWPGVAIQTVPEGARDIFIADPGHVFVGWDLAQAEARVVAVLTRDFQLLDDMEEGIDIHLKLASQLPFDMTYEELLEVVKIVGKEIPQRILAKTCRHAMNYYLSWMGLKLRVNKDYLDTGVGIDAALAKTLRNAYIDLHPGLESWWEMVWKEGTRQGFLKNDFGRVRNFLGRDRKYSHLHRDMIAFRPQSDIADLTTLSIARISEKIPWAIPLAHMHDGGFVQVPEHRVEEAAEAIKECTEVPIIVDKEELTIPSDLKVGPNWKDMEYLSV